VTALPVIMRWIFEVPSKTVKPSEQLSSNESAVTMAVTTEVPVSRPVRLQHRRSPVAVVAIALAVLVVLASIAATRVPASVPSGQGPGTSVTVPHPSPGPFGS
jgi:hypothetical protein